MSAPITASFRWTKDEFLRAQRLALRHLPQARFLRFMPLIGVFFLLNGVIGLYQRTWAWPFLLFAGLLSALCFSLPFLIRRAALKHFAQKPDRDMQVTWEIAEDGIFTSTELASSRNTWAFFPRVVRERDGFLIFPSANVFHWLPMHAFHHPEDVERFAELLKSKFPSDYW